MQNFNTIKNIGRKEVIWSYLATFLQIGSGVILFPLILNIFSSEKVGVWSIFITIGSLVSLLEFGFTPSFTRNITYIISGVNKLVVKGISSKNLDSEINYALLGNTIKAMKWFYSRIAIIAFILLISLGSYYINNIIKDVFQEDKSEIIISWIIFCIVNTYNIYTLYYDSLLIGFGLILRNKQIIIISQFIYLISSTLFLLLGYGLLSIVISQALMIVLKRILSYYFCFTPELKEKIANINTSEYFDVIKIILPNSIKIGLTGIGAFLVLQSSVIIGSLYLSLDQIASYGITVQLINVIASLSVVYFSSLTPKIAFLRVENDKLSLIKIYRRSVLLMLLTFILGYSIVVLVGNPLLTVLNSQTHFLNNYMILFMFLFAFLEKNHSIAGGFLLLKNEVPYFKASIISGIATALLLILLVKYANLGVWGMIIAPGLVQAVYQNWKWPKVLIKELT